MIREIRLLPPLAIARFGSSPSPMDNYDVRVRESDPLGFRELIAAPTFTVDPATGRITGVATPDEVRFKDGEGRVKPVSPFLELWCDRGDGVLRPLTTAILVDEGLNAGSVRWHVLAANLKAVRRTREDDDAITAEVQEFNDHQPHEIIGTATNFLPNKSIPFGSVQYIEPTAEFPEIRLRFTPGRGFVYGSAKLLDDPDVQDIVYRADGPWSLFPRPQMDRDDTAPGGIWAGATEGVSRGYLDDACDGIVEAQLTIGETTLRAIARIASGPPDYAPDSFPVRTVADELEQALLGPTIDVADASPRIVEEVVRRAFETIRLQHTAGLNGNRIGGTRISSMVGHDTRFARAYEPIMAPALVDNLALRALHQGIYAALSSGTAQWFSQVLRNYDEVADLSDTGRRKMPAMMRGSDGFHLALTRRQVDAIRKSSMQAPTHLTQPTPAGPTPAPTPLNQTARASATLLGLDALEGTARPATLPLDALVAQMSYRAAGNPPGTLPTTAISNCFPGLEFDFRNVWKRFFVGIELHEANNVVVATDEEFAPLRGATLLRIEHDGGTVSVTTDVIGPVAPGGQLFRLATGELLEWSNSLATILATAAGQQVRCTFDTQQGEVQRDLTVRGIFMPGTAVIHQDVALPGELGQSLCSPWQNDYRECGCYYWAASRPDYVNVEPGTDGSSTGHNWMQVREQGGPKRYSPDPPSKSTETIWYDDLFQRWEKVLTFEVEGKDNE